jgi:hypothetical protein
MKQSGTAKAEEKYPCTECGGDAFIAYSASTIKSGKRKGEEEDSWGGLVKAGERLCTSCFRKRGGIPFF